MAERQPGGPTVDLKAEATVADLLVMARTDLATDLIDRITRFRWPIVACWLSVVAVLAVMWPDQGDWGYFRTGSRAMVGLSQPGIAGGLHLYASMPSTQIGPPALVAALPFNLLPEPWDVGAARVVLTAAMLLVLWLVDRLGEAIGVAKAARDRLVLLGGFAMVPAWVVLAVDFTHLDDVMVLLLSLVAMLLLTRSRTSAAAVAVGLAVAIKPWAIVFVPLLLWSGWRAAVKPLILAGATAAVCWLPFLVTPGTLDALWAFRLPVSAGSGLMALGLEVGGAIPGWVRPAQLFGGAALAAVAVRRGNWTGVLLVGLAVRVALDPNPMFYYGIGPVLGALVWDLTRSRSGIPWFTALTMAVFSLLPNVGDPLATGVIRVVVCAALALSVLLVRQASSRAAGSSDPAPNLPSQLTEMGGLRHT